MRSQKASYAISRSGDDYFMSVYGQGEISIECAAKQAKRVQKAFPQLEQGFYDTLIERAKENNFTDKRLCDSVSYVIDTCKYPQPTVSNFISFDKKIRLYTYQQIVEMTDFDKEIFSKCKKIKTGGKVLYYKKPI